MKPLQEKHRSFYVNGVGVSGVKDVRLFSCVSRLTGEAGAGVTVPVVTAVAIDRTGVGAAGVGHTAARLHVHLPRLRQTQSPAHTQTLSANTQSCTNPGKRKTA